MLKIVSESLMGTLILDLVDSTNTDRVSGFASLPLKASDQGATL